MRIKPILKFVAAAVMPFLYLVFVVYEHYGFWDRVRGLDDVKVVAARMNVSYADAKRQYRPEDKEWTPTLKLIEKYTTASLPRDRKPVVIARYQAIASAKAEVQPGVFAEWTAPTTPLYVLYKEPPFNFGDDAIKVGDIGDLSVWIDKSRSDFRFYVQSLVLTIFSFTLGVLIWGIEHHERKATQK